MGPARQRKHRISRGRRSDLRDSAHLGLYRTEQYQCQRHLAQSHRSAGSSRWRREAATIVAATLEPDPDAMSANWKSGAPVFGDLSPANLSCTQRRAVSGVRPDQGSFDSLRDELERECAAGDVEERCADHRLRGKQGHAALQHSRYQPEHLCRTIPRGDEQSGRPFMRQFPDSEQHLPVGQRSRLDLSRIAGNLAAEHAPRAYISSPATPGRMPSTHPAAIASSTFRTATIRRSSVPIPIRIFATALPLP